MTDPMALVEAMTEEMSAISAEERLMQITDYAVGSGSVKRHTAQSHQRKLMRQSGMLQSRPTSKADLGSIGIKVMEV